MAAEDIRAQVETWAEDEIAKVCFGEQYGYAVTWGPVPMSGPEGPVMIPVWQLLITCLNPQLGGGDLFHLAVLGSPRPKEADVHREVASGIRQLRELSRSKISGSNGHAQLAVPG